MLDYDSLPPNTRNMLQTIQKQESLEQLRRISEEYARNLPRAPNPSENGGGDYVESSGGGDWSSPPPTPPLDPMFTGPAQPFNPYPYALPAAGVGGAVYGLSKGVPRWFSGGVSPLEKGIANFMQTPISRGTLAAGAVGGLAGAIPGRIGESVGNVLGVLDAPRAAVANALVGMDTYRPTQQFDTSPPAGLRNFIPALAGIGGALAGSALGPIGGAVGGIAGSALGGMFAPTAPSSEEMSRSITGSDNPLMSMLVGAAMDPLTYAGMGGGVAAKGIAQRTAASKAAMLAEQEAAEMAAKRAAVQEAADMAPYRETNPILGESPVKFTPASTASAESVEATLARMGRQTPMASGSGTVDEELMLMLLAEEQPRSLGRGRIRPFKDPGMQRVQEMLLNLPPQSWAKLGVE